MPGGAWEGPARRREKNKNLCALESPAADEHDVMEMDAAAYIVFWVLTQHVPQADAGFKSPLPMLPTLEHDARL